MHYSAEREQGVVLLTLMRDLWGDEDTFALKTEVGEWIEEGERRFLIDLGGRLINSTGIGIMVSAFHSIKAAEGRMVICGANKRVRGIYYVSKCRHLMRSGHGIGKGYTTFATCMRMANM